MKDIHDCFYFDENYIGFVGISVHADFRAHRINKKSDRFHGGRIEKLLSVGAAEKFMFLEECDLNHTLDLYDEA